jgi:YbbR domain-containing protein
MRAWLRHNLGYKALALLFACVLHFYVAGLLNARAPHVLILPLTVRNLPPTLILDDKSQPSVTLNLDGPPEEISRLTDTTVMASIDLSHARAGQTPPLPVHLTGLPADVTTESDPAPVRLQLQERRRRQLPVSADDIGSAPAGYTFGVPLVTPREVVITGTREAVGAVTRLVAQPDPDQTPGAVDEDYTILALDAAGSPVGDVSVTPPTAHVRMDLARVLARKTLVVSADVIGILPAPYRFGNIEVSPPTVDAEGRPDQVARIGTLTTRPVDVSGATKDIVRRVEPIVPPGLTLSPRGAITVTVHVIAPPAPALAPPQLALPAPHDNAPGGHP